MIGLIRVPYCFVLLALVSSCQQQSVSISTQIEAQPLIITKDSMSYFLKEQFGEPLTYICDDYITLKDTLRELYAQQNYTPLWWDALLGDSLGWTSLKNVFQYAEKCGMDTNYYFLPIVNYYRGQIDTASSTTQVYQILAECEIIISNSLVRMYEDIANGRVRPQSVFGKNYRLPLNNTKELDYDQFLQTSNKIKMLDKLHQNDTTYQSLITLLHSEQKKVAQSKNHRIDFSNHPKIILGDSSPIISKIIQRLKEKNLPDSSIHGLQDTNVYTLELQHKIRALQEKYSLTPDGIMGFKTYQIINSTPVDFIQKIKANIERQRWFNMPSERPYVYINLPEYIIDLNWEDSTRSFKVCIGKNLPDNYDLLVKNYTDSGQLHRIPKNMETPQIASEITYMVINPTWTIPFSIIRNEMWWELVRDPAHLSRTGHKVYWGDSLIDGDTINWSRINKKKIPYQIVQDPGPKNALGTVKFMFNNPFSIYLHDTPNKQAFKRTQRAVSHGCVRLEDPILFGEFLMQYSKEYTPDDFRIMMGLLPKDEKRLEEYDPTDTSAVIQPLVETTLVRLNKAMPLYFDYRTIYFDKHWKPHQCYDIYNENRLILDAMEKLD